MPFFTIILAWERNGHVGLYGWGGRAKSSVEAEKSALFDMDNWLARPAVDPPETPAEVFALVKGVEKYTPQYRPHPRRRFLRTSDDEERMLELRQKTWERYQKAKHLREVVGLTYREGGKAMGVGRERFRTLYLQALSHKRAPMELYLDDNVVRGAILSLLK